MWNKDSLKKITYSDWKLFKSHTVDMLSDFHQQKNVFSRFGGNAAVKIKSSGYFRIQKQGARSWIIDPDGHPFVNIAVNSIRPGASQNNNSSLLKNFGTIDRWITSTVDTLSDLGFNTAGSWSDTAALISFNKKSANPFPYTIQLNLLNSFSQLNKNKLASTEYPVLAYLFDPLFSNYVRNKLKDFKNYANDPFLFGYFSDNELAFQEDLIAKFLKIPDVEDGAYKFVKEWLQINKITSADITKDIKEKFSGAVADIYYSLCKTELKKIDPNHMFLGSRLHSSAKNNPFILAAAEEHLDIISINFYGSWSLTEKNHTQWASLKKPFIITEFYTKALDTKMDNISGAGWIVNTQNDRGIFYQNFALSLLTNKNCVGWHWFRYQDNDPADNSADPSNKDSNKGVVDTQYKWYAPLCIKMKQLNLNVYTIINLLDQKNGSL